MPDNIHTNCKKKRHYGNYIPHKPCFKKGKKNEIVRVENDA